MTATVTMKDLLEAGVHFGHQTSRWNPKMKPYIFGARNGVHIIDLVQTAVCMNNAYKWTRSAARRGKRFLFVGPKKQAAEVIGKAVAERAKAAGVTQVCFDRGSFKYHGRVAALADAARAAGLEF